MPTLSSNTLLKPIALSVFAAFLALTPSTVMAGHRSPLEKAALDLRQAAIDFEYFIDHSRYFGSAHRRLADDLEDATSPLRSATRRLDRPDRLYQAIDRVKLAKHKIQDYFFTGHRNHDHYKLVKEWDRVICAYDYFRRELDLALNKPHHKSVSRPLAVPAYRNSYRATNVAASLPAYRNEGYQSYRRPDNGFGFSITFGR